LSRSDLAAEILIGNNRCGDRRVLVRIVERIERREDEAVVEVVLVRVGKLEDQDAAGRRQALSRELVFGEQSARVKRNELKTRFGGCAAGVLDAKTPLAIPEGLDPAHSKHVWCVLAFGQCKALGRWSAEGLVFLRLGLTRDAAAPRFLIPSSHSGTT